jgi:acyl-CoA dehydrogenase
MDFALTPRILEMQSHLQVFIDRHILPANVEWHREVEAGRYPMPLLDRLKDRAKAEGLGNLFLPGLPEDEPGTRLSNLEYAPLAEMMGRLPWCSEVFNCSAPDTGEGSNQSHVEFLRRPRISYSDSGNPALDFAQGASVLAKT